MNATTPKQLASRDAFRDAVERTAPSPRGITSYYSAELKAGWERGLRLWQLVDLVEKASGERLSPQSISQFLKRQRKLAEPSTRNTGRALPKEAPSRTDSHTAAAGVNAFHGLKTDSLTTPIKLIEKT